uniref:G-protein coupled receptors family 1 profile domain-containing protein n=1 Tax=Glossina morsitans morsitans TaxID=37546 RepID=A0A1B0GFJ9_GLOMM
MSFKQTLTEININIISAKALSSTATATSLPEVRNYLDELDMVNLPAYNYLINDGLLLMDMDEAIANGSNKSDNFPIFNKGNYSGNETDDMTEIGAEENDLLLPQDVIVLLKIIAMSIALGLMILITIIGNVFVIAAIILERNLQNVANYLVVSLAVADLFVACLVMPLGAISKGWILGPELCDIWTSCDVLCCTASILHLVAIAADRYWTVTNIDYHNLRTPRRIFCMIFTVWFFAVIVSLAPQFGWKDPEYMARIEKQKCMVSQDVAYQIFATCCSFYVPLLVILVLYWKIYKIARKRIKRRTQRLRSAAAKTKEPDLVSQKEKKRLKICFTKNVSSEKATGSSSASNYAGTSNLNVREETEFSTSNYDSKSHAGTDLTTVSDENTAVNANEERSPMPMEVSTVSQQVAATTSKFQQHVTAIVMNSVSPRSPAAANNKEQMTSRSTNPHQKLAKRRQQIEAKRERKAAQTLAIITGAFVVCWLPFFVMALLLSLCKTCEINETVASFFLWLGYLNSTLNPIIYTIFNPEFRRAFQRLLFGKSHLTATQGKRAKNNPCFCMYIYMQGESEEK